jgi:hypothetical protein
VLIPEVKSHPDPVVASPFPAAMPAHFFFLKKGDVLVSGSMPLPPVRGNRDPDIPGPVNLGTLRTFYGRFNRVTGCPP